MRVLVQRSKSSSVLVDDKVVGKIDFGYVLLVGFTDTDTKEKIDKMVRKILHLRIFDDNNGVMNESILDHNGSILQYHSLPCMLMLKKEIDLVILRP